MLLSWLLFCKVRLRYLGTVELAWKVMLRNPGTVELADV